MLPMQPGYNQPGQPAMQWPVGQPPEAADVPTSVADDDNEADTARRPPNAFILYTQEMRSTVRQENPTLSNTEVSSLLGRMWKESVPNEVKLQYKQRAAKMQEEFKAQHPEYTYRKARRKRALNELLTKSTQGMAGLTYGFPGAPGQQFMFPYQQQGLGFQMPAMTPGDMSQIGQGMPGALQGQLPGQLTQAQQMQQLQSQMQLQMPQGDMQQQMMQQPQMFNYYPPTTD